MSHILSFFILNSFARTISPIRTLQSGGETQVHCSPRSEAVASNSSVELSCSIISEINSFQSLSTTHLINIEAGVGDAVRAEWSIQWESNAGGRIDKKKESESRDGEMKNVTIFAQVEFKRLSFIKRGQVEKSLQSIPDLSSQLLF